MLRKIKMIFVQNHPSTPSRLILNLTFLPSFRFSFHLSFLLSFLYFSISFISLFLSCVCVSAGLFMCGGYTWVQHPQSPDENISSPRAGVQIFVNHPLWVLGTRLGSPKRAFHMLNHWVIFLVPEFGFFILCNIFREKKRQYLSRVVLHRGFL